MLWTGITWSVGSITLDENGRLDFEMSLEVRGRSFNAVSCPLGNDIRWLLDKEMARNMRKHASQIFNTVYSEINVLRDTRANLRS